MIVSIYFSGYVNVEIAGEVSDEKVAEAWANVPATEVSQAAGIDSVDTGDYDEDDDDFTV